MRQDVAFHPGEAVSQKVVARLLSGAFDRIVTVDLNDVSGGPVTQLSAAPLLGAAIATDNSGEEMVLVGPDEEARPWVEAAAKIAAFSYLVGRKTRSADRTVKIEIERIDIVRGRAAVLIDDVVSTGSTIRKATRLPLDAGATRADLYVTHMLSSEEDTMALRGAGISRIVSTDSVCHPTNVVRLAPLLARALRADLH
jgi:ribose-phosphate pyrophosphokinase